MVQSDAGGTATETAQKLWRDPLAWPERPTPIPTLRLPPPPNLDHTFRHPQYRYLWTRRKLEGCNCCGCWPEEEDRAEGEAGGVEGEERGEAAGRIRGWWRALRRRFRRRPRGEGAGGGGDGGGGGGGGPVEAFLDDEGSGSADGGGVEAEEENGELPRPSGVGASGPCEGEPIGAR